VSLKELRQAFRDGVVFQGFAAPSLFDPFGLTGIERARFISLRDAMTIVKTTPRYDETGHAAFQEVFTRKAGRIQTKRRRRIANEC
jgi:hypothetical protein